MYNPTTTLAIPYHYPTTALALMTFIWVLHSAYAIKNTDKHGTFTMRPLEASYLTLESTRIYGGLYGVKTTHWKNQICTNLIPPMGFLIYFYLLCRKKRFYIQ